ncbi:MAG: cobalamin-dependent protein [Candidatus Caldarchaeum sp.]
MANTKSLHRYRRKPRILLAKGGLDGHDRGLRVLALALRDSGFEVVYLGMRVTAETVLNAAIEEDVDVIGLSFLSGSHLPYLEKLMRLIKNERIERQFKIVVGGVIPRKDIDELYAMGVDKVFPVGSKLGDIISYLESLGVEDDEKKQSNNL